jgi:transcriptional regulator GlxA family with amidase domain
MALCPYPPPCAAEPRKLRVGFVLAPKFTLTAFAGFVDALRLAADESDRSAPVLARWDILDATGAPVTSSCGAVVSATADLESPRDYDYVVVVGGLLYGGPRLPGRVTRFLQDAAAAGVKLVGLCTGSFILARAGLLEGYAVCVSWFHREDFVAEFPHCQPITDQMYVVDRQRLTCAGGTSVVHLAAYIIERAIGRASAVKALRILIEEQPLPSHTLQPEQVMSTQATDAVVRKAMLLIEQNLSAPGTISRLVPTLGIGRRQLERRFRDDIQLSPHEYRNKLRIERARWLLQHTNLDVLEVGLECGYQGGASFSRFIRKELDLSPGELRRAVERGGRQAAA